MSCIPVSRAKLGGRATVRLADVRRWRGACEKLAAEMDAVVGAHVGTILGANPWWEQVNE